MIRSDILAAEYRALAQRAADAADATALPQVRRNHERSASVWLGLAALQDQRAVQSQALAARLLAHPKPTRERHARGEPDA